MPSTISAGTTAGTAIAIAGDTTGNLAFQTNGTTTAMTIDTSQNVGVGTSSTGGARLQLQISKSNTTTTDMTDNSTLSLANSGTGNGVFNCIKFAANQQDMFISSFNNNTQANRRIGFFVGSVAGNATTDEQVSIYGNGNFAFNSGYGSTAVAYGCRAWVNFDGSTSPGTIRGSGNVSSVSRTGTGQYTVNFTTSMPDANYSVVGIANADSRTVSIGNLLAGSAAIRTTNTAGALENQTLVAIAVFR